MTYEQALEIIRKALGAAAKITSIGIGQNHKIFGVTHNQQSFLLKVPTSKFSKEQILITQIIHNKLFPTARPRLPRNLSYSPAYAI